MDIALNNGLVEESYRLEDRYARERGRVFLTGTQALVRIVLDQARRDRLAGLNTAGMIAGYRGSPVAAVDSEAWRAGALLRENNVDFFPAINEDLAATALFGTQQVESNPKRTVDGVFGMWYGKGMGVDRSGDALKHGNAYGTSPHGGVLVVAGDDHGCVSSSMSHQSDVAFMAFFIPILHPASVAEYLEYGEYGYALSRFSGMWVGFKAIAETVESGTSFELPQPRDFVAPQFTPPPTGLHIRWPDLPGPQIEARLIAKKKAVLAFADANPIDRRIYDVPDAAFGLVTTGKAHLDTMEALRLLGLDEAECRRLGIDVYKVGLVWPLAARDALGFIRGKQEILVIEEKRALIESQLKEHFYDVPGAKPRHMAGKTDETGADLVPWTGELSPRLLVPIIAARLARVFPELDFEARAEAILRAPVQLVAVPAGNRTPYFCSGCPHNSSTRVPEGSEALAGIGCHFMADWMDRSTSGMIQMGGEGVNWAVASRYTGHGHVFQNLGDGTYYHSGSLAIRQSIAAKSNITYKILFNDAVAMTGGQPVDGPISVQGIAQTMRAEGVERIALVSDLPQKFDMREFPIGTTLHPRAELDAVQRELREVKGVSVLIYEQTCATEKRRRRKRGKLPDPAKFAVINDLVCEGCGDCSVASNCLSVVPKETEFGRKRQIDQSNCNKDFSCLDGFCPSFVTVEGAKRRAKITDPAAIIARGVGLPEPVLPTLAKPYDLVITGVGGTGVVTTASMVAMAAHLEGKGASVLDYMGLAQKFGPVMSYLRFANDPSQLNQMRTDNGAADALIGCDAVVSTRPEATRTYRPGMRAVLNSAEMATADMVKDRDADLAIPQRLAALANMMGSNQLHVINANKLAEAELGDSVYANSILLGMAWQNGLVPVGEAALMRAFTLNKVEVAKNQAAFVLGRLAALDPTGVGRNDEKRPETLEQIIERRATFLVAYQNRGWAKRYRAQVARLTAAPVLAEAVAKVLFRLMSYKDEYEVARLHSSPEFTAQIASQFEGEYRIIHHLAPPMLNTGTDWRGRPKKKAFGPWMRPVFRVLAPFKRLRGTKLDPFGRSAERQMERDLIGWYGGVIDYLVQNLPRKGEAALLPVAEAALEIRGFGPVKAKAVVETKALVARLMG